MKNIIYDQLINSTLKQVMYQKEIKKGIIWDIKSLTQNRIEPDSPRVSFCKMNVMEWFYSDRVPELVPVG